MYWGHIKCLTFLVVSKIRPLILKTGKLAIFITFTLCLFSIDATFSNQCGRYVNDGIRENKNAELKVVYHCTTPHVVLFASRNICKGEEIRFDYGVDSLPWRQENGGVSCHPEM